MLTNSVNYYKATKGNHVQVVCLTATPDDGYDAGNERNLIELMGYKLIHTSEQKEMAAPIINYRVSMKSPEDVLKQVII